MKRLTLHRFIAPSAQLWWRVTFCGCQNANHGFMGHVADSGGGCKFKILTPCGVWQTVVAMLYTVHTVLTIVQKVDATCQCLVYITVFLPGDRVEMTLFLVQTKV